MGKGKSLMHVISIGNKGLISAICNNIDAGDLGELQALYKSSRKWVGVSWLRSGSITEFINHEIILVVGVSGEASAES